MRVQRYKNALRSRLLRRGLPEPLHPRGTFMQPSDKDTDMLHKDLPIPDCRMPREIRHDTLAILPIPICVTRCEATGFDAVAPWGE